MLYRSRPAWYGFAMSDDITRLEFTDEIDLHHFHPRDAKAVLLEFLDHAEASGYPMVRIVHGKGRSVLKEMVRAVLARRPRVARFADDSANWGATVVWLND